jgi:flavin reductase (DIM6/NTAB) family NADH-FMN oxidoreductase RutF
MHVMARACWPAWTASSSTRPSFISPPVALITTLQPDGSPNIPPMSSAWALDDRVVLGLASRGQCAANLRRLGECVINLPDARLWQRVEAIAGTTGTDPVPEYKRAMGFRYEPDKFARAGLTATPSQIMQPPSIAECPLQLEARVMATHPCGDDAVDRTLIVETRVERVHAHAGIVVPGTQHVDVTAWSPLLYVFRHYFGAARRRGQTFRAQPPAPVGTATAS